MKPKELLKIGTCSWKYDSWIGLIYSNGVIENYLKQYAKHYDSVEIDQWFWSLFPGGKVKLPNEKAVEDYNASVPDKFRFSIKAPNSITLTHYYSTKKDAPLEENPYFLSNNLFSAFLDTLSPMRKKLGPILFQFEYLNKKKMPSQNVFMDHFADFITKCPKGYQYALEIRNPNYLNRDYFNFLVSNNLSHVFLQGYYMPHIVMVFEKYKYTLKNLVVIRLHGPDRKKIEARTQNKWNEIVAPKNDEISEISRIILELMERDIEIYVNVNNHYEGSAPRTIEKILTGLKEKT